MRTSLNAMIETMESRTLMSVAPAAPEVLGQPDAAPAAVEVSAARRRAQPINAVGVYTGRLTRRGIANDVTLEITSQSPDGRFSGTITFTSEGSSTSTPVAGTIRGRRLRLGGAFGSAGVLGRARINPQTQRITGAVVQQVLNVGNGRNARIRSLIDVTRQPTQSELVPDTRPVPPPLPDCGCGE